MFEVPQGLPEIHVSEHSRPFKWHFLDYQTRLFTSIKIYEKNLGYSTADFWIPSDNMDWVLFNYVYLKLIAAS